MIDRGLDTFAKVLGDEATRRRALTTLAAMFGVASWPRSALACKKVGKKCDKTKDCCDGARCKGGQNGKCRCKSQLTECGGKCKNLDTEVNHCGACNSACDPFFPFCVAGECSTCAGGADHCADPPSTCEDRDDCFCMVRLETGTSTCGNQPRCNEPCTVDGDCDGAAFFCAAGGDACCSGSEGQGRCAELCAA